MFAAQHAWDYRHEFGLVSAPVKGWLRDDLGGGGRRGQARRTASSRDRLDFDVARGVPGDLSRALQPGKIGLDHRALNRNRKAGSDLRRKDDRSYSGEQLSALNRDRSDSDQRQVALAYRVAWLGQRVCMPAI